MKWITLALILLIHIAGYTQDHAIEAPYFALSQDLKPGSFPLISTEVNAVVNGPIADVKVTQTYQNNGSEPIEAIYVFPASTRAAVYHMEMTIGDRTLTAVIKEKARAREVYEQAKNEGKRTSLLEQHRPNVFQMNVANIMPGDEIKIDLRYTEFIIPENQRYQFVFPTVVGPRYTGEAKPMTASFTQVPYTKSGQKVGSEFNIKVHLDMAIPISYINSNTHQLNVEHSTPRNVKATLAGPGAYEGNRDFILEYSLAGNEIQGGVLTYEGADENYFLVQLEAPNIKNTPYIVPREYIFVLDVSGSMGGYPLEVSKQLIKNLLSGLRASDKFNILFFAGGSYTLSDNSLHVTADNISRAMQIFNQMHGGGGTNMLSAIKESLKIKKDPGYSRSYVIVTDGYVAVEEEAFNLIHNGLGDANYFAFGIGSSVNRYIIEGIAHVGRSEPFIVTQEADAYEAASKLRLYIEYPVLTDISLSYDGAVIYDLQPASIPDLMAERPIYVFGKFRKNGRQELTISGRSGNEIFRKKVSLSGNATNTNALSYLWAREKIRLLDDFNALTKNEQREKEITNLGLKYNLLTKYTSFVAVDDYAVNDNSDDLTTVKQPLSMPQGVPNSAIGFQMKLDDVVVDEDKSRLINVDVITSDKYVEQLLDASLQIYFERLNHQKILKYFVGNKLTISRSGGKLHLHTSKELPDEMNQALLALCERILLIGLLSENVVIEIK